MKNICCYGVKRFIFDKLCTPMFLLVILFCIFHEIQTFILLILTAASLVPVSIGKILLGRLI